VATSARTPISGTELSELPEAGCAPPPLGSNEAMLDDNGTDETTLRLRLDVRLDRRPVCGALRTEEGAEELFVGWVEFVGALDRLHRRHLDSSERREP
jgi:hypothetical protein